MLIDILLVEDNPGDRKLILEALKEARNDQFKLDSTDRLATALERMDMSHPDAVILDLSLPDSEGLATFTRLHSHAPDTPIVVLTGLKDEEVGVQAVRAGAQDYLLKGWIFGGLLVRALLYAIERKRAEEEIRQLSGRLLQAQEDERRIIAMELHDSTAQSIASIALNLSAIQSSGKLNGEGRVWLENALQLANECMEEIRDLSHLLHPPLLDERGLSAALAWYVENFQRRTKIPVDLEAPPELGRLPKNVETALFRIVQESLTNMMRHSGSPRAKVEILLNPSGLVLQIIDEGKGIAAARAQQQIEGSWRPGLGLSSMRERTRQIGGQFQILSSDKGTTIRVTLAQIPASEPVNTRSQAVAAGLRSSTNK